MAVTPGGDEPTDEVEVGHADADDVTEASVADEADEEFPDDEDVEGHMFGLPNLMNTADSDLHVTIDAKNLQSDTLFAGAALGNIQDEIIRRRF